MSTHLDRHAAAEIRVALARREMKPSALALAIDRDRLWLHRRMSGDVSFKLVELESIAAALDVPVSDLLPTSEPVAQ